MTHTQLVDSEGLTELTSRAANIFFYCAWENHILTDLWGIYSSLESQTTHGVDFVFLDG